MFNRASHLAILAAVLLLASPVVTAGDRAPIDGPWMQYPDVRVGGFDAEKLEVLRGEADELGSGAVFIVRGGLVVAAWGDVERKFKCHSVRKTLLSALYGPAVAQGRIKLEATLAELGIDDVHDLTESEGRATVEQLIQSRSGVYHPAAKEPRSMKQGRPARGSAGPGEAFWYNNWDFNTAGYVFELATGRGIFEAFAEDLAEPLGMEDFQLEDTHYQYERKSSQVPAYAFRLSARDLARVGLLYLWDGKWGERQLVPAEWVERSWTAQTDLGDGEGYGYMWWIYGPGTNPSHPDLSAFAARGTGGQLLVVVPQLDLVVVHRADTDFSTPLGGAGVWKLIRGIIDAIDGESRPAPKATPVEVQPFAKKLPALSFPETVSLPAEVLERYVGHYQIGPNVEVEISRLGDILVGQMTGFGETDLYPTAETDFWSRAAGVTVKFELDDENNVVRGTIRMRGQDMVALPVSAETAAAASAAEPGGR